MSTLEDKSYEETFELELNNIAEAMLREHHEHLYAELQNKIWKNYHPEKYFRRRELNE